MSTTTSGVILKIPIEQIDLTTEAFTSHFVDEHALGAITESFKRTANQLVPILVDPDKESGKWRVVDGILRVQAAHAAGMRHLNAVDVSKVFGADWTQTVAHANFTRRHLKIDQRIIQLLETAYPDFEHAKKDMDRWHQRDLRNAPLRTTAEKLAEVTDRIIRNTTKLEQFAAFLNLPYTRTKQGRSILKSDRTDLVQSIKLGELTIPMAYEMLKRKSSQSPDETYADLNGTTGPKSEAEKDEQRHYRTARLAERKNFKWSWALLLGSDQNGVQLGELHPILSAAAQLVVNRTEPEKVAELIAKLEEAICELTGFKSPEDEQSQLQQQFERKIADDILGTQSPIDE